MTLPSLQLLPAFQLQEAYPTQQFTSRDLLAFRAGFPAFYGDILGLFGYDRADVLRRLRFVDTGDGFRETALYSNLSYFGAGEILAEVYGKDWETAMTELLYEPLGMTRTNSMVVGYPADGNYARNHAIVDGVNTAVEWDNSIEFGAAGGVISTANDMARWMKMLVASGDDLLTAATRAELFKESMVSEPGFSELPPITAETGFNYGLGWGVYRLNGHTVLEKGGALGGIRTVVELIPELQLGVAVLVNQNLTTATEAIRAYVLEQYIGPFEPDTQEKIHASYQQLMGLFASPEPVEDASSPPSLALNAYTGAYQNDLFGEVNIVATEDGIGLEGGPAKYSGHVRHIAHDVFWLQFPGYTTLGEALTFTIDSDGVPSGLTTESMGSFVRVK